MRAALGPRYKVQTGSEKAKADSKGIADVINGFLGPALLAFGGVAVLVGAFIIFNMFSITVAQRIREIAMLRTLGASRRQILTSVLLEALTTGLVGTIIGIFAGLLIALGINALFDAVGFGLPVDLAGARHHGRRARAHRGARRDARLGADPGRARDQDPAHGGPARRRDAAARALRALVADPRGLFALGGAALIVNGVTGSGTASQRLLGMAGGAVLIFLAVAMTARFAVPMLARIVGAPLAWRASGALARDNAMRNAARTARTAAALMIGVGLVVFVAVLVAGLAHVVHERARQVPEERPDRHAERSAGRRHAVAPHRRRRSRASRASGAHRRSRRATSAATAATAGCDNGLYGVDPTTIGEVYKFEWVTGGNGDLSGLDRQRDPAREGRGVVAARERRRSVHLLSNSRKRATVTVRGIYKDDTLMQNGIITSSLVQRLTQTQRRRVSCSRR